MDDMGTEYSNKASQKVTPYLESISESTIACLVTMVQGNVLALGLSHLLIASQTGVIAGVIATATVMIAKTNKRWLVSVILGVVTAMVDFFIHPGMFGSVVTEAIVTGIAAAVLSYLAAILLGYLKARRNSSQSA